MIISTSVFFLALILCVSVFFIFFITKYKLKEKLKQFSQRIQAKQSNVRDVALSPPRIDMESVYDNVRDEAPSVDPHDQPTNEEIEPDETSSSINVVDSDMTNNITYAC